MVADSLSKLFALQEATEPPELKKKMKFHMSTFVLAINVFLFWMLLVSFKKNLCSQSGNNNAN